NDHPPSAQRARNDRATGAQRAQHELAFVPSVTSETHPHRSYSMIELTTMPLIAHLPPETKLSGKDDLLTGPLTNRPNN
ncbi:hypothetical protein, partial [Streptomyces buecherae]|uniref:hypothetical protein n=1 Tax=Streptomyces buecherae TaxID=2763006 RepID=UPI001C279979